MPLTTNLRRQIKQIDWEMSATGFTSAQIAEQDAVRNAIEAKLVDLAGQGNTQAQVFCSANGIAYSSTMGPPS
jgi:predicted nucleotide-binding protein